jgi:hypothetical protein
MGAEFGKTQASCVQTGATRTSVVVIVGDVFECRTLESGEFHARNVAPNDCGLYLYKSYRVRRSWALYESQSIVTSEEGTPRIWS